MNRFEKTASSPSEPALEDRALAPAPPDQVRSAWSAGSSDPAVAARTGRGACELTGAFLLLRLFLGLRTLLAGLEKFEAKGTYSLANYHENMNRMAEGITAASFLPIALTRPFASTLGFLLLGLGGLLLLGLRSREVLFLTGILYVALAFGLMAVQEAQGVAWLGVHVGLIAGALVLVRHERFAVWRT